MALVGICYFQPDDPGVPPAGGYEWYNTTTGQKYIRNLANTTWNLIGTSEDTNMGLVPAGGRTMTGPLPGVSEYAPIGDPDFTGAPKKGGIRIATMSDISSLRRELLTRLGSVTTEALAGLSKSGGIKNSLAIKTGITTTITDAAFTIPLPQYDGGSGDTAIRSEVLVHLAWPIYTQHPDYSTGTSAFEVALVSDSAMTWHIKSGREDLSQWVGNCKAGWLVVAAR